jgi:hypothetical protein
VRPECGVFAALQAAPPLCPAYESSTGQEVHGGVAGDVLNHMHLMCSGGVVSPLLYWVV